MNEKFCHATSMNSCSELAFIVLCNEGGGLVLISGELMHVSSSLMYTKVYVHNTSEFLNAKLL